MPQHGGGKEEIETSTYLWSSALESAATAGPWIVKNHRSGKNDVVVQDENHTLYWIAADGTVSWKKSLEEPISGALHQVDLSRTTNSNCSLQQRPNCTVLTSWDAM